MDAMDYICIVAIAVGIVSVLVLFQINGWSADFMFEEDGKEVI